MNFSARNLIILFAGLLVFAVAGYYFTFRFVNDSIAKTISTQQQIADNNAQIRDISDQKNNDIYSLAGKVNSYFIKRDNVVSFIENIEQEARSLKIEIFIRSVDEAKYSDNENENKEFINLQIETRGSWADTLRFVSYLERLPYKISLNNVELAKIETELEKNQNKNIKSDTPGHYIWRGRFEFSALKIK